jgi:predicted RNA-binding Zn-ribbon protein involved in translation (DUF1610 family)
MNAVGWEGQIVVVVTPAFRKYNCHVIRSAPANLSEAERYATAWRDRKRRFVVYVVESNFLWIVVLVGLLDQAIPRFDRYVPGRFILLIPAWFVGNIVAGIWLNRFRCPRCGNLFYWKWTWKMERAKKWRECRHCGLKQDSGPT